MTQAARITILGAGFGALATVRELRRRDAGAQITVVSPDVILESVEAGSVKVISSAAVNPTPVSPNVGRNTMLGGVLGLVISVGIILLAVLLDNKIHTEDDVAKYLDLAVVGVIPEYQGGKKK